MKTVKKTSSYNIALMGILYALAIVLTGVEYLIPPLPLMPPGVKLGLANIVTMYCLFFLSKKQMFLIVFLKSAFVFLIRGATAFLISLSGGVLSALVMVLVAALAGKRLSYLVISIFGAISHNVGQLILASFLLGTNLFTYYLPLLIIAGVIMGYITGMVLKIVIPALDRIRNSRHSAPDGRRSDK